MSGSFALPCISHQDLLIAIYPDTMKIIEFFFLVYKIGKIKEYKLL